MPLLQMWMLQNSPTLQPNGPGLGSCSPTKSHIYRNDQKNLKALALCKEAPVGTGLGNYAKDSCCPERPRMGKDLA